MQNGQRYVVGLSAGIDPWVIALIALIAPIALRGEWHELQWPRPSTR